MRLTSKQKFIAASSDPECLGFDSRKEASQNGYKLIPLKEIRQARMAARGHFWDEGKDFDQFCSYSPNGKKEYFEYIWFSWGSKNQLKRWKKEAKTAAKLWALGKCADALTLADKSYLNSDNE